MPLRKANVLVVDDHRANLLALDAVLGEDYNVLFANSGDEAIALLGTRDDIDVVLMDVQMPDMDGFEAAQKIKQMPGRRDVPIIFVTAIYTEDPFVKRGYEVGGIDYFSKPFDPEVLRLKVGVYSSFRLKNELLRERELHVRESEELIRVGRRLSALLESLPVGVLIADGEGRICQSTEEASRILNTSHATEANAYGDILGWWESAGKTLKNESSLARALREGESSKCERLQIRQFDGDRKVVLVSASPLRGLDRRIIGAVILIRDVTGREEIEDTLQERVARLVSLGIELEESGVRKA